MLSKIRLLSVLYTHEKGQIEYKKVPNEAYGARWSRGSISRTVTNKNSPPPARSDCLLYIKTIFIYFIKKKEGSRTFHNRTFVISKILTCVVGFILYGVYTLCQPAVMY